VADRRGGPSSWIEENETMKTKQTKKTTIALRALGGADLRQVRGGDETLTAGTTDADGKLPPLEYKLVYNRAS
jgi:hypothetical protein